ncbi:MAG: hypothetical protein P1V20_32320, partial [Verrucomicrobiales bacterium]|nr:hypothetical protein [Verrucomicrobiales bacterium]
MRDRTDVDAKNCSILLIAQRAFVSKPGVAELPRELHPVTHDTLKGLRNPFGVELLLPWYPGVAVATPGFVAESLW